MRFNAGHALNYYNVQPIAALPGVPTVAEAAQLPGFEADIWFGMLAPAGVPEPERVAAAAAPLAAWLGTVDAGAVLDGLAAAADPLGALHALERLLHLAAPRLAPDQVRALLRVLGGSATLAQTLAAEE